jgi:hypothetical protein
MSATQPDDLESNIDPSDAVPPVPTNLGVEPSTNGGSSILQAGSTSPIAKSVIEGIKNGAGVPAAFVLLYNMGCEIIYPDGYRVTEESIVNDNVHPCNDVEMSLLIVWMVLLVGIIVPYWWKTLEPKTKWPHRIIRLGSWIAIFVANSITTPTSIQCFYPSIDRAIPRSIPVITSLFFGLLETVLTTVAVNNAVSK